MATNNLPSTVHSSHPVEGEDEAQILDGILSYNSEVQPKDRKSLVAAVMRSGRHEALTAPAPLPNAAVLLRPGVVQAIALAGNYSLVLGLEMSGTLQDSAVSSQAVLIGLNYLVLTSLMMALSLLCLAHSIVRVNLRPAYRALLVAMTATGAFGIMEGLAFSTPLEFTPLMLMLFVVVVPIVSLMIALYTVASSMSVKDTANGADAVADTLTSSRRLPRG